jgi:hypothetical protein
MRRLLRVHGVPAVALGIEYCAAVATCPPHPVVKFESPADQSSLLLTLIKVNSSNFNNDRYHRCSTDSRANSGDN